MILENQFNNLSPAAKKCMQLTGAIASIIMIAIILAAWLILNRFVLDLPQWTFVILIVWIVVWLIYLIVAPIIRYRRYQYLIDEEKVVVKEGLLFVTQEFAPIERMHQITVKSGPIDRLFGLANVIATTAGGTVAIRFLQGDAAEEIADTLQAKVRYLLQKQGITLEGMANKVETTIDEDSKEV